LKDPIEKNEEGIHEAWISHRLGKENEDSLNILNGRFFLGMPQDA